MAEVLADLCGSPLRDSFTGLLGVVDGDLPQLAVTSPIAESINVFGRIR